MNDSNLSRRLDYAAARMNPFLAIAAVGLALLTLTSFALMAIEDVLPPLTRVIWTCAAPS